MEAQDRRRILNLLEENARYGDAQIATMLGLEAAAVTAEIKAMEQAGIIRKYAAVVNWEGVKEEGVTAVIDVKVHPQREVGFDRVAERIYRHPEVRSCTLMSGTYDLSVVVEGKDLKEVARFVSEKLATLESVSGTTTHFILKRYKQDGAILADPDSDERLVVAP